MMNKDQQAWLTHYLYRLAHCGKILYSAVMQNHYLKTQQMNEALYQRFLYEAAINDLNKPEKACVLHYADVLWDAYIHNRKLPDLVYRNLLNHDFTYHQVDLRTFMANDLRFSRSGILLASTIYQRNYDWFIYLYIKEIRKSGHSR